MFVQIVAGLFVSTFQRLSIRQLGFSAESLLVMDADTPKEQPLPFWMRAAEEPGRTPGV